MEIRIETLGQFFTFVAAGTTVLGLAMTLHWRIFAEPRLKKILAPYSYRLDALTRVIRFNYPAELKDAEKAVFQEREIREAI